jgi:hypothetical protein
MKTTITENQNQITDVQKKWKEFFESVEKVMTGNQWTQGTMFTEIVKGMPNKVGKSTLESKYSIYKSDKTDITLLHDNFEIGKTNIDELNIFLKTKYSDILNQNKDLIFEGFTYFYLYYYEGSLKEIGVKPAIICFKDDNGEWGDGVIYYLRNDDNFYKHSSTFKLIRVFSKDEEKTSNQYYRASYFEKQSLEHPDYKKYQLYKDQVNLFTFYTSTNPVNARYLFFANILTNNPLDSISASLVGVMKQMEKNDILNEIQKEIDLWIKTALLGKRSNLGKLETHVFRTKRQFEEEKDNVQDDRLNKQLLCYTLLKGNYFGVYLGYDDGITLVVLQVKEDGKATIFAYGDIHKSEPIPYKGVFSFPNGSDSVIKGNFVMLESKIHRLTLYLEFRNHKKEMIGILTGFNHSGKLFTTPIVFYRDTIIKDKDVNITIKDDDGNILTNVDDRMLQLLKVKYNPSRIPKHGISDFFLKHFGKEDKKVENVIEGSPEEILKSIKTHLSNFLQSNFGTIETRFPKEE